MLLYFCKALQELGDNTLKMNDERINKNIYDIYENDNCKNVDKLSTYSPPLGFPFS